MKDISRFGVLNTKNIKYRLLKSIIIIQYEESETYNKVDNCLYRTIQGKKKTILQIQVN